MNLPTASHKYYSGISFIKSYRKQYKKGRNLEFFFFENEHSLKNIKIQ